VKQAVGMGVTLVWKVGKASSRRRRRRWG